MSRRPTGGLSVLPLTVVVITLALAATSSATADDIFPFEYRRVEFDNGFRAFLVAARPARNSLGSTGLA